MMRPYADRTGRSGIAAFAILKEGIIVEFKDDGSYLYNYAIPGEHHVEEMKKRAKAGACLATYINQHVRANYFAKLD